MSEVWRWWV